MIIVKKRIHLENLIKENRDLDNKILELSTNIKSYQAEIESLRKKHE